MKKNFLKAACLVQVLFIAVTSNLSAQNHIKETDSDKLTLWYEKPADTWMTEALPIGNGPLGAMLFGGTNVERIQFNEISLWSGDRMPKEEELKEIDMGSYQAFGDVFVRLGHDFDKVTNYKRSLDLSKALHLVEYDYMGVHYVQKAFVSHPANVIVVQLTADKPMAFTGDVWLTDMHNGKITLDKENQRFYSVGDMNNGFEYESQLQVITTGEKLKMKRSRQESNGLEPMSQYGLGFVRADAVTLIISAGTNFKQDFKSEWLGVHPHDKVTKNVDLASARSFDELFNEHLSDYQNLFGRVAFDLGKTAPALREKSTLKRLQAYKDGKSHDPELEALFCQYGRYLLISCSRPNSLPANLQGVWNHSNQPEWSGDYHSNINLEMNYWPAETANLSECHVPFIDYVSSLREVSALNTQKQYGDVRGWTVQTMNNATGLSFWKWNAPGSAWYAQHLWEHYAFGLDEDYLRNTAYPILKEVCHFWEDHLKRRPDGTLVTPDGWSPEQYKYEPEEGVTYDQEIIYDLFTNTIEAAEVLGDDEAFKNKLIGMRNDLLKPAIGRWGQLKEWEIDKDDPDDHHRHVSHLFALYPGRQISVAKTPELAEAARVSLNARGDESTGWSRAWKINFWARLGDGDRSYKLLRNLINLVDVTKTIYGKSGAGVYANLLDSHPPFQIDGNLGATAGYCEMLMQSHAGEIQVLPALPSAWADGYVKGLRARAGFEVDITWENSELTELVIHSKSGMPCKVTYKGQVWESKTKLGESYRLSPSLKIVN